MSANLRNASLAALAALAVLLASCGDSGDSPQVITDEQLARMVLARHQFGPDVRNFALMPGSGPQSIDALSGADFYPPEEREDLQRHGFEAAYDQVFEGPAETPDGITRARSGVIRFADEEGAAGYFDDQQRDLDSYRGQTSAQGYTVNDIIRFDAGAENTAGAHIIATVSDGGQRHDTQVMFRHGRLVGWVTVGGAGWEFDRASVEERVSSLMLVMDQQVQLVLAGSEAKKSGSGGPLYVSSATDALGKSAKQFEDQVESVSGDFSFQLAGSTFNAAMNGDFGFSSTDEAMFMRFALAGSGSDPENPGANISLDGIEFQVIYRDGVLYMLTPFTGWVYGEPDDVNIDGDGIDSLIEGGGPIDYASLFKELGEVEDLGIEQTEAGAMRHYRLNMDVADVVAAFGGMGAEDALPAEDMSGAVTFDIWLHSDSLLPHRLQANGQIAARGEAVDFTLQMNFRGYGEPVVVPEPPADAAPIEDAFGNFEFSLENELRQAEVQRQVEAAFADVAGQ